MHTFAVMGIGNNLLQDDGAGIHTIEMFSRTNTNTNVRCLDGGTVGLALMSELADLTGLIAVDAMRLRKPAGTVTVLEGADMDLQLRNHCGSAHEVGLSDLMDALRLSDSLPPRRALIGIEPADIGWGTEATPAVSAALPKAVECIQALLDDWTSHKPAENVA